MAPVLLLAAWSAVPAAAQERGRPVYTVHLGTEDAGRLAPETVRPDARRHARKTRTPPEIGDARAFNTRGFLGRGWQSVDFTLQAMGDGYHLWVETAELDNGHVTDADVAALDEALGARTPSGSADPNAGILANNRALFGAEPDYDGDGVVDLLWFDIRDDYPSDLPLVAYVTSEDYDPGAPDGVGNQADVLYLDTDPLLTGADFGIAAVQATAAGVHQALIHFNYDPREITFLRTGLFEWAKVHNGYDGPGTDYLLQVAEHNIPLFSEGGFAGDIQRAARFLQYLVDQFGPAAAGLLTREAASGGAGLRRVLGEVAGGRTLEDVVLDFHTANLLNDPGLDPRFGYAEAEDARVRPSRTFDAGLIEETPPVAVPLAGGGVQYLRWDNVADLDLTVQGLDPDRQDRLRLRAFVEALDGSRSIEDLAPGDDPVRFGGGYARVTLVAVDAVPEEDAESVTPFVYAATWTGPAVAVTNVAYDNGFAATLGPNFLLLSPDLRQTTRFAVPTGARLGKVFVSPFFANQFITTGGPATSPGDPRDLVLGIWADDGTGHPGALRFSRVVEDPRPFFFVTSRNLDHFAVDLTGETALADLSGAIHVSLGNAGDDENSLVLAVSVFLDENVSFLDLDGTEDWLPVWEVDVGAGTLVNRFIPIRAQFLLPEGGVATEEPAPGPAEVLLHANYPNPFHPRTTIRYDLPQAGPVRLAVYDVLGRQVALLVDAWQPAGAHAVPVDGEGWAGGVYLYTLDAGGHRHTRAMTVMK